MRVFLLKIINFFVIILISNQLRKGLKKALRSIYLAKSPLRKRSHEIKIKNINIFSNIYTYISKVISASKETNAEYLIISISPYTF